jgi:hypothetical protein
VKGAAGGSGHFVIASAAKQSGASLAALDCFVALLLAMTGLAAATLRALRNKSSASVLIEQQKEENHD